MPVATNIDTTPSLTCSKPLELLYNFLLLPINTIAYAFPMLTREAYTRSDFLNNNNVPLEGITMLRKITKSVLFQIVLISFFMIGVANATDTSSIPKKKRTTLGLYYTPAEAAAHMKKSGNHSLFLDVRDPIEVNFTGTPSVTDANIPFKFADTRKWHMKKKQFGMLKNINFVADVDARMKAKGLSKSDPVILMCRSGVRSGKAANLLTKAGYTKVYNMFEGFEGDSIKKGPNKGQRTINGWKNSNLAWSTPRSLDISKMYGNPAQIKPKKK
jgi:rhodanese-related sulfurtransferase